MIGFSHTLPKLVLPALFFGYALWVTGSFLVEAGQYRRDLPAMAGSLLNGEFTAKLETIYKDRLPYRLISADLMGAARFLIFGQGRKGVVVGKDGWLFSSEEYRTAANEAQAIAATAALVAKVSDQLADQGTRLIVLPLPAKADIYREYTTDPSRGDAMAARYESFLHALNASGVDTVDTKTALLSNKASGPLFLKSDTHWSPRGAAIVAQATAEASGPLGDPTDFAIEPAETLPVEGDLTKFIVSANSAGAISLMPETVTVLRALAERPAGAGAVDIFGGTTANVALVGTSYSADERWGFLASLKADLQSDIVNFAEAGHGPLLPMQAYLKGRFASETPPKLVIWEFPVRYLTDPDVLADVAAGKE